MRLTLHTDYALRALIYLALRTDRLASIHEIAQAHAISENHLVKVIHNLGRGGFVAASRGRGGGLRLARPAGEIGIGEVVRFTEGDMALVACFQSESAGCALIDACRLQRLLGEALSAFLGVLDGKTLADLVKAPERPVMAARLGLADAPPPDRSGAAPA